MYNIGTACDTIVSSDVVCRLVPICHAQTHIVFDFFFRPVQICIVVVDVLENSVSNACFNT